MANDVAWIPLLRTAWRVVAAAMLACGGAGCSMSGSAARGSESTSPTVRRFDQNPIIRPNMDATMGENINGPSLIRVPDWVDKPLGRYYLYFAHHKGKYIRLAYADRPEGPWTIHTPGVLDLKDSFFTGHIASPDVHVDEERKVIRMYYHGPVPQGGQRSRVAMSTDGMHFAPRPEILGEPYFRVFRHNRWWYAMAMPGIFYRSRDGLTNFERGPTPFAEIIKAPRMMRHSAFMLEGDELWAFYSCIGDRPERILLSKIKLSPDWGQWTATPAVEIIQPETEYEGSDLAAERSRMGWARDRVRQLRDPGIYREGGRTYLLYSVAGEHGIAIAELQWPANRRH